MCYSITLSCQNNVQHSPPFKDVTDWLSGDRKVNQQLTDSEDLSAMIEVGPETLK